MKFSSLAPRVLLPFPLAFGIAVIMGVLAAGVGIMHVRDAAAFTESGTIIGALLWVAALQVSIGLASVHLLRRRSLLIYALTAVAVALIIGAIAGTTSWFDSGADTDVPTDRGFELQSLTGILGISIPALVVGYAAAWWRFTWVPRQLRRKRKLRSRDGRLSHEEIASATIAEHPKTELPGEGSMTSPARRISKRPRRRRR